MVFRRFGRISLKFLSVLIFLIIGSSIISTPVNVSGQFEEPIQASEDCFNGFDDDADGLADGDDLDCGLVQPAFEDCFNGFDDDADGLIDSQDTECTPIVEPPLPPAQEICEDGIDNNGDGSVDEGCAPPPPPPEEVCDNVVDDNGDGSVDEGCASLPPPEEVSEPQSEPPGEQCGDGMDNNEDGLIDEGCAPPAPPSEELPYQPLEVPPPGQSTGTAAQELQQELSPPGQSTGISPEELPQELPPPGQSTGTAAQELQQELSPPGQSTGISPEELPQQPPELPQKEPVADYTDCPNNMNLTHCLPPGGVLLEDFAKNVAPVASAGEDQQIDENSLVTLDGSGSHDSDGNISSFSWVQISGDESVTISQADSSRPSLYAPQVTSDMNLTFELTVFDDMGYGTSDEVNVLIKNIDDFSPLPINGSIILESIPDTLDEGTFYTFKGELYIDGASNYGGKYVQIIDASGESEDVLSFGSVDNRGLFVFEWQTVLRDTNYNIYALYEDENGSRLKSNNHTLTIKPAEPRVENLTGTIVEEPFIPIEFNNYLHDRINVYIVAWDRESVQYLPSAKQAIEHWSDVLKDRSGNHNAWNFEYFNSRDFPNLNSKQFRLNPLNILVNLKNADSNECKSNVGGTESTTHGVAHTLVLQRLFKGTIQIYVYTACDGKKWFTSEVQQDKEVERITSHELGHALGLGHTWNEKGDMMCSSDFIQRNFLERILRQTPFLYKLLTEVYSCSNANDYYKDTSMPSNFDIGAIIYAYGRDGFGAPNPRIFSDTNYTCSKEPKLCNPSEGNDINNKDVEVGENVKPVTSTQNLPEPRNDISSQTSRASVSINPACGPSNSDSFEVSINGNGFKLNSDVGWKLEASDKSIPYYGYFETDEKGAFKGKTLFDDLGADNYKIHFGENVDSSGVFTGEPKVTLGLIVPCSDERESKTTTEPKSTKSYQLIVYLDDATPKNAIGDNFKVVVYNSANETVFSANPNIDFNDNHQKISPRSGYPIIDKTGQHPEDIRVCAQQEYTLNDISYLHDDCYKIKQNIQKTYWYTVFDYGEIDGFEGDTKEKADKPITSENPPKNQRAFSSESDRYTGAAAARANNIG